MDNEERMEKLRQDIATVVAWRKADKVLTKEEQFFAEEVGERMIGYRVANHTGVQVVTKMHIDFIKGMQPIQGSDAVGGIVQDVVANRPTTSGKFSKKPKEDDDEEEDKQKVKKAVIGESNKELPKKPAETKVPPKNSPDIAHIKQVSPENQEDGEVTATADLEVDAKDSEGKVDDKIPSEAIGHNPNLPMPKKQAEDLVGNARWGVEIGVYGGIAEGIEAQLSRKEYAEFIDTDEKLKEVKAYLKSLVLETEPTPVA